MFQRLILRRFPKSYSAERYQLIIETAKLKREFGKLLRLRCIARFIDKLILKLFFV